MERNEPSLLLAFALAAAFAVVGGVVLRLALPHLFDQHHAVLAARPIAALAVLGFGLGYGITRWRFR